MNGFINLLKTTMDRPTPYGWFHLLWIAITIICIIFLKNKKSNLRAVLGIYGIIAFILELLKQLSWSISIVDGNYIWDYQWYAFPFQLCSMPIYISLICFFANNKNLNDKLLPFLAYITILGGISTILIPDSCFTNEVLININTMWIHCGSLVISIYLLMSGTIKPSLINLRNAINVFVVCIITASLLNVIVYNFNIANGETFNMFYISPYFISELPIFNTIQQNTPYMIYLLSYFVIMVIGGLIIFSINYYFEKRGKKNEKKNK